MRTWKRIRYLLKRHHRESELAEELRAHQEMMEDDLRRQGVPTSEARHATHRTMGNITLALEHSRSQWNFAWLESLLLDLRYAARTVRRTPLFACMVIGTIGLALGLNSALFSIFNAYVLRPLAVRDPYGLYQFGWNTKRDVHYLFTASELKDARSRIGVFEDVLAYENIPSWVRADNRDLWGAAISGNYFTMLGVGAALGRTILPRDDDPANGEGTLVLSYGAWKDKFGAAPDIVGTKVHLRGYLFEVAGVARREFAGLGDIPQDFWVPLASYAKLAEGHTDRFRLIGRLKADMTLQQARAALDVWAHRKTADGPEADQVAGVRLWPRATSIPLDADSIGGFATILAAFALVLLIACANVANMMLARAMARQREIGIRLALGAARSRLVRQLLTEGLVLALPAAAVGFFAARTTIDVGLRLMWATIPPDFGKLMRVIPLAPDVRVFLFTLIAAGLAAIVFSLVPALHATRPGLVYAMRGDFSTEVRRSGLRNGLIVGQVTVCVLLLICGGVLLRADRQVQTRDLGIDASHTLVVQVQPKFRTQVLERLALEPAVETVGAAWRVPFLDGLCPVGITPSGQTNPILAGTSTVSPEYFSVFHISLVRGRNFTDEEAGVRAPAVIISEATAQRFWPKQDALGQTLRIELDPDDPRCKETSSYPTVRVIGIARNVSSGMASADAPNAPCLYFPLRARSAGETSLLIRVKGDAEVARRNLDRMLAKRPPEPSTPWCPCSR